MLWRIVGLDGGPFYNFYSGLFTVLVVWAGVARAHNCNARWCPRIGRHDFTNPDTGVTRRLCWRHHPEVHSRTVTTARIRDIQHRRHLYFGSKPGKG